MYCTLHQCEGRRGPLVLCWPNARLLNARFLQSKVLLYCCCFIYKCFVYALLRSSCLHHSSNPQSVGFCFRVVLFFFFPCWKSITYYSNDLAFFSRCSNRGGRCPSDPFFTQLHFSVSSTCELSLKIRNNDVFLPRTNWNLLERAKKGTRSFDLRRPRYSYLEGQVIQFIHVNFQWRK